MHDELKQLTEAQTEAAREVVQMHINAINEDYARLVEKLRADTDKVIKQDKRGTYLVWLMFWISGFLMRGFLVGNAAEWETSTFLVGFAFGACVYLSVYGFMGKE